MTLDPQFANLHIMLDEEQQGQRQLVAKMAEAAGVDLSTLARRAGVVPSTLTRFMNGSVKHLLSARTLAKLGKAAGFPVKNDDPVLSQAIRVQALKAVAQALGVAPELATLNEEAVEALEVLARLAPDIRQMALEFLRGLGDTGSPTNKSSGPSETLRRRRAP